MAGLSGSGSVGKRKAVASPTNTPTHPAAPKIKLNLRSSSPALSVTSKPRKSASQQRKHARPSSSDSESSELTPPDEDDELEVTERITPRALKTSKSGSSRKASTVLTPKGKKKSSTPTGSSAKGPLSPSKSTSQSGPGGRDRKRMVKNGERDRRRARDDKFSIDLGDGYNAIASSSRPSRPSSAPVSDAETTSSYGDDEDEGPGPTFAKIGHESDDDGLPILPDSFAGQDVEDLAYGAGEMFTLNGWGDDNEEEDEVFIAQLSGSEADIKSQSSVQDSASDAIISDTDEVSTSDDEVDEFGFPIPSSASLFPNGSAGTPEAPLVLMENWDGQLVLVQPRQERSRSRHRRGSRGSRGSVTNASIADSMVTSTADPQGGLRIDPDADDGEFDSDSSFWSGESDKGGDGDTTDSMDEDDMPMLDSPALQGIIEQQMMNVGLASAPSPIEMNGGPSIVITDAEAEIITAAMTDIADMEQTGATPQTPAAAVPTMGMFHPVTAEHPSQHAVIDGSKTTTKSPFTHRRRPGRGRDGQSVASSREDSKERKRKSPTQPFDPFSPLVPSPAPLTKRARYSSIPGHPRFRRAHQAEYEERASTPSDEEDEDDDDECVPMDLGEMIHESVMAPPGVRESPERHFRFDRVRVEGYLRRTLMSSGPREAGARARAGAEANLARQPFSSPTALGSGGSGATMLRLHGGITETLMGHFGGPLVSPILAPVVVENRRDRRRRDRERAREVVPLQI